MVVVAFAAKGIRFQESLLGFLFIFVGGNLFRRGESGLFIWVSSKTSKGLNFRLALLRGNYPIN